MDTNCESNPVTIYSIKQDKLSRIGRGIGKFGCMKNYGDKFFEENIKVLIDRTKKILGDFDYENLLRFFRSIVIGSSEVRYDVVVALARRAQLLFRIFLPIIMYVDGIKDYTMLPTIISDKGVELHDRSFFLEKLRSGKKICIVDEAIVYGRSMLFYRNKIKKYCKAELGLDIDITLKVYLARDYLDGFEYRPEEKKMILNECYVSGDKNVSIEYMYRSKHSDVKNLLDKMVRLFYFVGAPFAAILPLSYLETKDSKDFLKYYCGESSNYAHIEHDLENAEYFKGIRVKHHIFYLKKTLNKNETPRCFRVIESEETGKSFVLPSLLLPNLSIQALNKSYQEFVDQIKANKFNELHKILLDLPMSGKDEVKYSNVKYRILSYFLHDGYLREILNIPALKDKKTEYFYNGLDEHLPDNLYWEIRSLHGDKCIDKEENVNTEKMNEFEKIDEIVKISQDIFSKLNNIIEVDNNVSSENKDIPVEWKNIFERFETNIATKENWSEILKDLSKKNEIYSKNAFTHFIYKLTSEEDYNYDNEKGTRSGYRDINDFIESIANNLEDKRNITEEERSIIKNEIYALIIFNLDFGILTINMQPYKREDFKLEETSKQTGVFLRCGEEGLTIDKVLKDAYKRYYGDYFDESEKTNDEKISGKKKDSARKMLAIAAQNLILSEVLDNLEEFGDSKVKHTKFMVDDIGGSFYENEKRCAIVVSHALGALERDNKLAPAHEKKVMNIVAATRRAYEYV